ncbi:regulatory protein RecX [Kiloniella laminariae]|uniref:regulatory protein RecX n=1 Tax=Kiloniella laminariae TaxID=454162 RepID=UPI00037C9FBA|nr:regulatory protein RecX [Kiloniella laminariae]
MKKFTRQPEDGPPKRKVPRKATPKYLGNVARFYLERYATTETGLRRYLMRKVTLSAKEHDTDPQEGIEAIEALITKFRDLNFLNDERYAEGRSGSLHRRGTSLRAIRQDLSLKGVPEEEINKAINIIEEESINPDLEAAVSYARRRRMGPYRPDEEREERRERDMAALGRKGFSYAIAEKVIQAEDLELLEEEAGLF